MLAFAHGLQVL